MKLEHLKNIKNNLYSHNKSRRRTRIYYTYERNKTPKKKNKDFF